MASAAFAATPDVHASRQSQLASCNGSEQMGALGFAIGRLLEDLAKTNPQAFLCHFYNIYFAHTAGGRMIGLKVR